MINLNNVIFLTFLVLFNRRFILVATAKPILTKRENYETFLLSHSVQSNRITLNYVARMFYHMKLKRVLWNLMIDLLILPLESCVVREAVAVSSFPK